MYQNPLQFAFIGPGGPEFLLVLLVLIMLFGAKDAPRILRRLNEIFNQLRNTAEGFKREVMYSDLASHSSSVENEDHDSMEDLHGDDDDGEDGQDESLPIEPSPDNVIPSGEEDDAGKI